MKSIKSSMCFASVAMLLMVLVLVDVATCKKSKDDDDDYDAGTCTTVTNSTCPDDYVEIYKDVSSEEFTDDDTDDNYNTTTTNKQCCTPDTQQEKTARIKAGGCQITDCLDSSTDVNTICTTALNPRWINDQQLQYESVMYDTCQQDKNTLGIEALCCPRNSKEGMLTLLLGAEKHQFPHFAMIRVKKSGDSYGICSGTIYNERYIITASHCMLKDGTLHSTKGAKVELKQAISSYDNPETYDVEEFILHPNSTKWLKKSNHALPIAPTGFDPFKYSEDTVLIGIGTTDTFVRAHMLQRANVLLRTDERNVGHHGPWHKKYTMEEADGVLFVGGIQDGKTSPRSAPGDSGGPAICRDGDGNAILCGLDSNGPDIQKCEDDDFTKKRCYPIAFMEIQHYYDWFVSVAGDQSKAKVLKQPLYGAKVPDGKYEHQVRILAKETHSCGGTLIEKDVVLTAAHCVADDSGNPRSGIQVVTGVRNVNMGSSGKTYDVVGVKVLDGFKQGASGQKARRIARLNVKPTPRDPYYTNDLALIKLSKEVDISSKKLPKIGTAKRSASDDDNVVWHTEVSLPLNTTRAGGGDLQQRKFKLLLNEVCQKRMDRASYAKVAVKVDNNVMCGEEMYNGGAQCDRELGGGLMCREGKGKGQVLCGVQVFRFCQLALPSAFLDLSLYNDWVNKAKQSFK